MSGDARGGGAGGGRPQKAGAADTGAGNTCHVSIPRPVVLVVDDEPAVGDFLRLGLGYEGFHVHVATDGRQGLEMARRLLPDLVVLDIMLPELDGLEVLRRLRSERLGGTAGGVPVLMLTAKDEVEDRVAGLNLGADDYLPKPFRFEELLARARALLRRRPSAAHGGAGDAEERLAFADLVLDAAAHEVRRGGRLVDLTPREFALLRAFLRQPRRVLSREALLDQVWGHGFFGDAKVVDVYVRYLRHKLGPPEVVHTVRGVGYVLRPPPPAASGDDASPG